MCGACAYVDSLVLVLVLVLMLMFAFLCIGLGVCNTNGLSNLLMSYLFSFVFPSSILLP